MDAQIAEIASQAMKKEDEEFETIALRVKRPRQKKEHIEQSAEE